MKVEKITENVFRFTLTPLAKWQVYSYLINTPSNIYIIDTGCGNKDAEFINEFIKNKNFNKPLVIINTHYHYDHIWGNGFFNYKDIIASAKTYQAIIMHWNKDTLENSQHMQGNVKMTLPTITFNHNISLENSTLLLLESKGHTEDGICIYYKPDQVLFVGDNIGDDDIEIIPELECSKEDYIKAINDMLHYDIKYILSGHNNPKSKDFLYTILKKII